MNLDGKTVLVTGVSGFLGQHLIKALTKHGANTCGFSSADYDLTKPSMAYKAVETSKPDLVIHAAARVGGILANKRKPYTFGRDNLLMGINVIDACIRHEVPKLVLVSTTCAYPSECPVPFREDSLWSGYPEPTNAPYGVAKRVLGEMIAAASVGENKLLCATTCILANLYGPSDNFDPENSHVIPALIRRFCEAVDQGHTEVECWGTGLPTRDFLHVRDAAEGICRACEERNDPSPINLGTGIEYSIAQIARMIAEIVGYKGAILWNKNGLDGQNRRALCTQKAWESLRWEAKVPLMEGLTETVEWWRDQNAK